MQHRRLAASLGLLSLALAGCAGGRNAGSGQPGPSRSAVSILPPAAESPRSADASLAGLHACRLIPAAVAARVLGRLASPPGESPDGLECFYYPVAQDGKGTEVLVTIMDRSAFERGKVTDRSLETEGVLRVLPVTGIGDDGYLTRMLKGAAAFSLTVAKAGRAVNIAAIGQGAADEQRVRDLMVPAIGNL